MTHLTECETSFRTVIAIYRMICAQGSTTTLQEHTRDSRTDPNEKQSSVPTQKQESEKWLLSGWGVTVAWVVWRTISGTKEYTR